MRKILVLLTGKRIDDEALDLACRLGQERNAQVYAVAVVEMRRTLPLDTTGAPELGRAQEWLAAGEAHASAAGCAVKTELLTARAAGPAVIDEIVEKCVDAVVIGVPYDRRFGEFEPNEAVLHILKHAPCQVWLVREAAMSLPGRTSV